MEAHNWGVLFVNIPGAAVREIALMGINTETKGDVEKSQISERRKYLATAFLIISDRLLCGELILSLKNYNVKQQSK